MEGEVFYFLDFIGGDVIHMAPSVTSALRVRIDMRDLHFSNKDQPAPWIHDDAASLCALRSETPAEGEGGGINEQKEKQRNLLKEGKMWMIPATGKYCWWC